MGSASNVREILDVPNASKRAVLNALKDISLVLGMPLMPNHIVKSVWILFCIANYVVTLLSVKSANTIISSSMKMDSADVTVVIKLKLIQKLIYVNVNLAMS
jgi:hypothetical protein